MGFSDIDDVRNGMLLYKPVEPPNGKPANVGWHTDRGYWKTCTSANMLTAWIPFHDCDERMGTITMIEGELNVETVIVRVGEDVSAAREARCRGDFFTIHRRKRLAVCIART